MKAKNKIKKNSFKRKNSDNSNQNNLDKGAVKTELSKEPKENNNSNGETQIVDPLKMGTIHEASHYMRGNEYILRGYRLNFDSAWKIVKR